MVRRSGPVETKKYKILKIPATYRAISRMVQKGVGLITADALSYRLNINVTCSYGYGFD